MDKYFPVKTGDTFAKIAKELGHEGEAQALMDASHPGGPTNQEQAAKHLNLVAGADGEATDSDGRLIRVLESGDITANTKLVEGLSLLLPGGA